MVKKNAISIAIAVLYTLLFNNTEAGVNQFVFSIVAVVVCYSLYQRKRLSYGFAIVSVAALSSGAATFWYGTALPVFANRTAILMLPIVAAYETTSLFSSLWSGMYSLLTAPFMLFFNQSKQMETTAGYTDAAKVIKRIVLLGVAVAVAFVFLLLYAFINPILAKTLEKINFDFISIDSLLVLATGWVVSLLIVYPVYIHYFQQKDTAPAEIEPTTQPNFFRKLMSVDGEIFLGTTLLLLVNLFLLLSNGLDIYYLLIVKQMPEGVTLSEYVHSGAESVIVAIVLATFILLYFFRNEINYSDKNKAITAAAYLWIVQNIVTVLFAANRNFLYIGQYALTHKRIGLLFFFCFCVIGLITVLIKIKQKKKLWFLFRINYAIVFVVMTAAVWMDWDRMITLYNIHHFGNDKKISIDERYLASLSHTNLVELYDFYVVKQKKFMAEQSEDMGDEILRDYSFSKDIQSMIEEKYAALAKSVKNEKIQSYCYTKHSVIYDIEKLKKEANEK